MNNLVAVSWNTGVQMNMKTDWNDLQGKVEKEKHEEVNMLQLLYFYSSVLRGWVCFVLVGSVLC